MRLALKWALIVCFWAVAYLGIDHLHRIQAPHQIGQAEYLPSPEATPPLANVAGTTVTLPHEWSIAQIQQQPFGWYRVRFDYAPTGTPWVVYLAAASMNAAVFVNGTPIGAGGRVVDPVSRNLFRPLLLEIPSRVLQQGPNEAVILVRGVPPRPAYLGPLSIGPEPDVRPHYALR